MVRILFSKKVKDFIEHSKSGLRLQIKKFENSLKNHLLGDFVFIINNIECREIKIKGLRFFTIQYKEVSFVLENDEFKDIIKVIDYANKNKKRTTKNY